MKWKLTDGFLINSFLASVFIMCKLSILSASDWLQHIRIVCVVLLAEHFGVDLYKFQFKCLSQNIMLLYIFLLYNV